MTTSEFNLNGFSFDELRAVCIDFADLATQSSEDWEKLNDHEMVELSHIDAQKLMVLADLLEQLKDKNNNEILNIRH